MESKITKAKEFTSKNLKWLILFICLIIFLAIAEDVFDQEIMHLDQLGYQLVSTHLISQGATPIAIFITNLGGTTILILITILLVATIKNKKIALTVVLNPLIITGINLLLKSIVQRPRPTQSPLITETGFSFPSGHSMVSMAFYGYLICLIAKFIKNKLLKVILIVLLSILIISIGISRIYLGVHYTSDVIAGFMISLCYLVIYTSMVKKLVIEREEKNDKKDEKIDQ